jgi:hypothetical protein
MNAHNMRLTMVALLATSAFLRAAPVELGRESFEGNVGEIGFTTEVPQFEASAGTMTDFFKVIPNNGSKIVDGIIASGEGALMFAGEDLDAAPNSHPPTLSLTTDPFSIAGKTSISVKILLAAPGTSPSAGGTVEKYDHSATASLIDFVRVDASIDGGPFNPLIQFSPSEAAPALNSQLKRNTDFDGLADAEPGLTEVLQDFDLPIPTGNSVEVRVVFHSNQTSEYICIDNIRIFGETPITSPPIIGGVPTSELEFSEGGLPKAIAPSLTLTDADSPTRPSATITISQGLSDSEDVLAATPSGAVLAGDIVYTAATGRSRSPAAPRQQTTKACCAALSIRTQTRVTLAPRHATSNSASPMGSMRVTRRSGKFLFLITSPSKPSHSPKALRPMGMAYATHSKGVSRLGMHSLIVVRPLVRPTLMGLSRSSVKIRTSIRRHSRRSTFS